MIDNTTALSHLSELQAYLASLSPQPSEGPGLPTGEVWQTGSLTETFMYYRGDRLLRFNPKPLEVKGLRVKDAFRLFDTPKDLDLSGAVFDDIRALNLARDGIRVWKGKSIRFGSIELRHSPAPSRGENLPEGIALMEGVEDVTIEKLTATGFHWEGPGYKNGDGLAAEGGTSGTILQAYIADCSDAGLDLKGRWVVKRALIRGCSRSLRAWEDVQAELIVSDRPSSCHLWAGRTATPEGKTIKSNVRVDTLVARGGQNLIRCESSVVRIGTVYTDVPEDDRIKVDASGNDVRWDKMLSLTDAPLGLLDLLGQAI